MLRIRDELAGDRITFCYVQTARDLQEVARFIKNRSALALDTESNGLNCYRPGWKLTSFQCGDAVRSYVVPARYRQFIGWAMRKPVRWIGHNGPHDIRCIDEHLGYATQVVCAGETFIVSHHRDPRNVKEGGVGHELKELAIALVDPRAGRWEVELNKAFKQIEIPIPGEVYKSGPRKGTQKVRKARLAEGWGLIEHTHPAFIAYAAADPILTYRVWKKLRRVYKENRERYAFDHRVQMACDELQRRAMLLDVAYTERLSAAFTRRAERMMARAAEYGCANIHSGQQVAATLLSLGANLTARTPTGQYKTSDDVLRALWFSEHGEYERADIVDFIRCVLVAKQLIKRRESYTDAMLREMDRNGRVHPSVNTLGARTTRMSVSRPPLQQLPTKDRDDEEE